MDKIEFFQKKVDSFFSKKSAEKKRSLKLIISFSKKYEGKLKYELWSANNEFIEYQTLQNILNLSFLERSTIKMMGASEEKMEQALIKWLTEKAQELAIEKEHLQGQLKINGDYALLQNREYLKELQINEII